MPETLVVIETSAGEARESCFELINAASDAIENGSITALIVGYDVDPVATRTATLGVDRVLVAEHPEAERYTPDVYSAFIEAAVIQTSPDLVLLSGTTSGRDLGPYLAAKSGQECLTDCVEIKLTGDTLTGVRPVYQGKMLADVTCNISDTAYAVVRAGAYEHPVSGTDQVEIEPISIEFDAAAQRTPIKEVSQPPAGDANLGDAEVVVVGGRGVGSAENFALIEALADALNAPVGATRAVTDLGWRPHYEQIGQTGKSIHPSLYIGAGVSGAVQHTVGMRGSETIVAINRDPGAPIFRLADIGVIGDLNEVLPALTTAILEAKSQ